ncbi:MAG: hypothetical protein ISS25_03015 [Nanoarchaeota archaeon]|nr:hypothetical protein [DPANN group archaeon]MBL7116771.1 hypothetical protein [Nanoarchaeota archaeon]
MTYVTAEHTVLRNDTELINIFNDSSAMKQLIYNSASNQTVYINASNQSRIWSAKLSLTGHPLELNDSSYQEPNATIIQANDINNTNTSSSLATDKNWSSYYSSGQYTGLIAEIEDLTLPENIAHMVFHAKLRVYSAGTGRFAVYNYNEDIYEVVTSTIPATNESYQDIYLDIYDSEDALWTTNETHFSLKVENLSNFINGSSVRYYYRYINSQFASQKFYEAEVKFIPEVVYPKNISIDFGDDGVDTTMDELYESTALIDRFNDSSINATFTFTNNSYMRYLSIPKNAEIVHAVFKVGNSTVTHINATVLEVFESELFEGTTTKNQANGFSTQDSGIPYISSVYAVKEENSALVIEEFDSEFSENEFNPMSYCYDWTGSDSSGYVDDVWYGPYCADDYSWHNSNDIDNDGYVEYYMLKGETYSVWARCDTDPGHTVDDFCDDGCSTSYGCYDGNCDSDDEKVKRSTTQSSVSSTISYPDMFCFPDVGDGFGWLGGNLWWYWDTNENGQWDSGEHQEYGMVLECGVDADCADNKFCDKHNTTTPTSYTCETPVCSPSCGSWQEGNYSNHVCNNCIPLSDRCDDNYTWRDPSDMVVKELPDNEYCNASHYPSSDQTITCEESEYWSIINHVETCTLLGGRCNETDTYINETSYCDTYGFIVPIITKIYIGDYFASNVPSGEIDEIDFSFYLQRYLEECSPNSLGYCEVPINFTSPYNTTLMIDEINIVYENFDINFTNYLQNWLLSCGSNNCNYPISIYSEKGIMNISHNTYRSPETAPQILNITHNSIAYVGKQFSVTVNTSDNENDTLTITANVSNATQDDNQLLWTPTLNDIGNKSVLVTVSDGLLNDSQAIDVEVIALPNISITDFSVIYSYDYSKIFKFTIWNNGYVNFSDVSWSLDLGDGTIVNNSQSIASSYEEYVDVYFGYNYSTEGSFTPVVNVTANDISVVSSLNLGIGLTVHSIEEIYSNIKERVLEITIGNEMNSFSVNNVNWSLDDGNGAIIHGNTLVNISPGENMSLIVAVNYSDYGPFTVVSSAFYENSSSNETLDISIDQFIVDNLSQLDSSGSDRVFEFTITGYEGDLSIPWELDTGEINIESTQNISINLSESVFVIVSHNYSGSGSFIVNASANTSLDSDSQILNINV